MDTRVKLHWLYSLFGLFLLCGSRAYCVEISEGVNSIIIDGERCISINQEVAAGVSELAQFVAATIEIDIDGAVDEKIGQYYLNLCRYSGLGGEIEVHRGATSYRLNGSSELRIDLTSCQILEGDRLFVRAILGDFEYDSRYDELQVSASKSQGLRNVTMLATRTDCLAQMRRAGDGGVDSGSGGSGSKTNLPYTMSVAAWPNPSNAGIEIHILQNMERPILGELEIFDVRGRKIKRFALNERGATMVKWDGTDRSGRRVASGLYLVRFRGGSNGALVTHKVTIVK